MAHNRLVLYALFVLSFASIVLSGQQRRYDNYRVYSIVVRNEEQYRGIEDLKANLTVPLTYWKGANYPNSTADVMVAPEDQPIFEELLYTQQVPFAVKIENVQPLIDDQMPHIRSRNDAQMDWNSYHNLDEINAWLDGLLEKYPFELTNMIIGVSVEGRPLRGVKLSRKPGNKVILIESTTHAREWIAAATATYFLNELLTSTDPDIVRVAENYDWIIFPVINPDGYVYTFETNRMWRNNMRRYEGNECFGVDNNRNWGFEWRSKNVNYIQS